ncbi:MAG: SPASM domain-containing protein [Acidobacteriota bacterium]
MSQIVENFRALDLFCFRSEIASVLFVPETLQLFQVSSLAATIIIECRRGVSLQELSTTYGINGEIIESFLTKIISAVSSAQPAACNNSAIDTNHPFGLTLPKLVLMVNNYCNLKCIYCYEHEAVFKKKPIDMSQLIAKTALDKCYSTFDTIRELMFIGGEPSLSEEVIDFACNYTVELASISDRVPPMVSMITNGVKMSDRLFDLIEKYNIQVTFSIDGPKVIQNLVRIRHDNSGSYNEVKENIIRYAKRFQDKLGIECTVTRAHKDAGITVSDLVNFFSTEFGVRDPHIAPAGLTIDNPLNPLVDLDPYLKREFEAAAAKGVENIFDKLCQTERQTSASRGAPDLVFSMLRKLIRQKSSLDMCPAGTAQLVVDAFGDLYPCWMFSGMEQFKMGNILWDDIFNQQSKSVLERINKNTKRTNSQCSTCYARYLCNACIGNNQNVTGAIESIDERFCNSVRSTVKTVLLKLGEAKQDKQKWAKVREEALCKETISEERVRL